ncbi:MAG: amidase family protein [Hyphomicrobiales bacterium]
MSDLVFKPALELGRLLKRKKISAVELLGECLTQYARHNARINAVILTDLSRARAAARAADERIAKGETLSPFDGVPMTIKESFDWAGHPSTWGDPALIDNVPAVNAVAVQRMMDAGVVVYGKTNVPLNLADWQSFNEVYGTTNNPWGCPSHARWLIGRGGGGARHRHDGTGAWP